VIRVCKLVLRGDIAVVYIYTLLYCLHFTVSVYIHTYILCSQAQWPLLPAEILKILRIPFLLFASLHRINVFRVFIIQQHDLFLDRIDVDFALKTVQYSHSDLLPIQFSRYFEFHYSLPACIKHLERLHYTQN